MANKQRMKIDILAAPESTGSILYGLYDALTMPGTIWPRVVTGEPGEPLSDVRIVAKSRQFFTCRGGTPVTPQASLMQANDSDLVCVANISMPVDQSPHGHFRHEVDWLRQRYADGATIATVCSGAILLAETGLLDGCEATSHWAYDSMFKRYFPDVRFRPDRILTFAGDGDRLVIAGGMSSWQDLALYLIARFYGVEYAIETAKIFVFADHAEGQLPYAALSRRIQKDDPVIARCQAWIAENYATPDPISCVVAISGLPQRTFSRRFKAATDYRPMEYVQAVRIEEAKQLLERETTPIEQIACAVGYDDPRAFRRLFSRRTGLSPGAYRKRFNHMRFLHVH